MDIYKINKIIKKKRLGEKEKNESRKGATEVIEKASKVVRRAGPGVVRKL